MAYATRSDMITTFGERALVQLTDRVDPPAGMIDQAVLDGALDYAAELIDGHLRARYRLPLTGVHRMLTGVAQDIAFWRLNNEPTEEVRRRYDAALKTLQSVQSGAVALPDETGGEPPALADGVMVSGETRAFSRTSMRGY